MTMKRRYKTGAVIDADRLDVTPEFLRKVSLWTSFYRQYPFIFAEHFLGIKLEMFQKIILYGMMHNQFAMFIASRGKPLPHLVEI